ncbi:hypothetical protein M407DRAFT_23414 [Tulasnella calospora MUT 4182]|uniref:DUF6535 domain-containing protein n=2 Tax=Tulasnella calospora MUT 4182 TaxID=1051891 RepID=A0A0C3QLB0_9AGAM|nr:hypothetical protein M407DRAFT_23414 [Tulasnella calospora MUT 4182]
MNTTANIFEQPITECPEIPARFGEDGGKFYYYYDQLTDELDEDLTKRLKSQLDSLLIFAGLFAGVNSAFLALTLPMMSADPADDTNALLLQLVKGGNTTINSEADLPSATFSPPSAIYPVNILFAVSLTCALMSSFLAVLGQQWLVYYRKRSGGGAEHQRKEQLRRQLGAQRWRLELVLDDILPSLLQVGLVIFCIAFVLYLRTLSGSTSFIVAAIVGAALAITVGAAVCATWDRMCPYQSPLSHLLCWTTDRLKDLVVASVWFLVFIKAYFASLYRRDGDSHRGELDQRNQDLRTRQWNVAERITSRKLEWAGRKEETTNNLVVSSVKRVILTSEHTAALIHAATNICAIDDEESLRQLLNDAEFVDRLHGLFHTFRRSQLSSPDKLQTLPLVAFHAVAAALLHLALSVGTIVDRPLAVKSSPQTQIVLSHDLARDIWRIARNVKDARDVWDGNQEHISHLGLFGFLLSQLDCSWRFDYWRSNLRVTIDTIADLPPSHHVLCTLACAVKVYIVSSEWDPEDERWESKRSPWLFELARVSYRGPAELSVPFLLEIFQLSFKSQDGAYGNQYESYKIRLDVFCHACEWKSSQLDGVFASMGRLMRDLELDIRHPIIRKKNQEELRAYRDRYVRTILRNLVPGGLYWWRKELYKSLTETLIYIRELAAAREPGHPENRFTLDLFRLVQVALQDGRDRDHAQDFEEEYVRFDAWVNMGGCAKSPGRLNRDPELCWCPCT